MVQIARQTRPRDLEEFFSAVGSVRDVRIITDSRTGRSKGIAYVEFWEEESVPLGLALSGQKLLGMLRIVIYYILEVICNSNEFRSSPCYTTHMC